jgi:2-polyprenyl-6-methoxyphenol hydroxylase-like FAD-dependent oxidoreductase
MPPSLNVNSEIPTQMTCAAVIGGSIAGLMAARVLAERFDHVVVFDRDTPPDSPRDRKCVPQGPHIHALLPAGGDALQELFPGILEEFASAGGIVLDAGGEVRWFIGGVWRVQEAFGIPVYSQSRAFLEFYLRQRVHKLANVECRYGCEVLGLVVERGATRVEGVRVRSGSSAEDVRADLVVDCSGRGSRLPAWLEEAGYGAPEESTVTIHIGYSSRIYRPPSSWKREWVLLMITPTPPDRFKSAAIFVIEGGKWMVTLGGRCRNYPPHDEAGFLEFAREVEQPDAYEAICTAEPLTPIVVHRFLASVRLNYAQLKPFPAGLLPLGDSIASFNPVYGQGMTVAALEAVALRHLLRHSGNVGGDLRQLCQDYFRETGRIVDHAWAMAAGADLNYRGAEGHRPPGSKLARLYMKQVLGLGAYDADIAREWACVAGMVKRPVALFHPRIAWRVLRHTLIGLSPALGSHPGQNGSRPRAD